MAISDWFKQRAGNVVNRLTAGGYIKAPSPSAVILSPGGGVTLPIEEEPLYSGIDNRQSAYERLALTCSWVYSNINVLANEGSKSPFGVQEQKGEEQIPVYDHAYEQIMRRPNPHMSGTYLKKYTIWWWMLRGEAYWLKVFDRDGVLRQIYPLPSDKIKPIPDSKRYIKGYKYYPTDKIGARGINFKPEQIVFFRFPNPFKYHRGLAPLSAYLIPLLTDTKAAKWNMTGYDKGMTLQTLISLRPELSKPQYTKARDEIVNQLVDNQQRFLISRAGDVNATKLSLSPREADYLASREMSRDEIDRVFGFPEGYWSMLANRANAEQARASLIDGVVWPLLTLMCEEITAQIIIPQYGENLLCVPEDIRIQDRQLKLQEYGTHWQVKTYNEARTDLELEPYSGPFANMIGPLPMSLATNPSFILAVSQQSEGVQSPPSNGGEIEPPAKEEEDSSLPMGDDDVVAMTDDLKTWRGIELRRVRAGDAPGYDFKSDCINDDLLEAIKLLLADGDDEQHVENTFKSVAVFVAGGAPSGEFFQEWEGYG